MSQLTGKLDDYALMDEGIYKGSYAAMIDGKAYTIMPHVVPFLLRLEKGIQIDAILNKDKAISKIKKAAAPAAADTKSREVPADPLPPGVVDIAGDAVEQAQKRAAAGFLKDTQGPAPAGRGGPAAGNPPAGAAAEPAAKTQTDKVSLKSPGLRTVEGNIAEIDFESRYFTLEGRDGKQFIKIYWKPPMEDKMKKQKVGFYENPMVEVDPECENEGILIDLPYKDRGDFPRLQVHKGGGGGGRGQPRNEKPMIYESVFKSCCDQVRDGDFQNKSYEERMKAIWTTAKGIGEEIVQLSGA